MVWDANGYLFVKGAIDFAGGTVVHINAGIAALVGCLVIGKRVGYGKDNMAPHSMVMTMIGASMLWVGWFGFNVGSNLEANGGATLAMINTFIATAAATLTWCAIEGMARGKASMLGAASGMVAGLVAVTPACGTIGPMGAILLGVIVSAVCYFFVTTVKHKFSYDDSLDVFGIHGIGGIIGAVLTGVFSAAAFGGVKGDDYAMGAQLWVQIEGVVITILWSGVVSFIAYKLVDVTIGLRVDSDTERQGLDLISHGEQAYHS
jgi:Amt family ammonium transporter